MIVGYLRVEITQRNAYTPIRPHNALIPIYYLHLSNALKPSLDLTEAHGCGWRRLRWFFDVQEVSLHAPLSIWRFKIHRRTFWLALTFLVFVRSMPQSSFPPSVCPCLINPDPVDAADGNLSVLWVDQGSHMLSPALDLLLGQMLLRKREPKFYHGFLRRPCLELLFLFLGSFAHG